MNKEYNILKSNLNICRKHLFRLNQAYNKILPSLPITPDAISHLGDEQVEHIDQFIFRFSKLQDAIGEKLFKSVLIYLGEDISYKSAIDIFNKLDQLGVVNDYESWKALRNLRNELAHEYEEDENNAAEKLNMIISKKTILEKYFNDIVEYLTRKGVKDLTKS